ncbi:nitrogenase component 1 [Treponema endosymbiont of Eucomonympha sp.]|uniref:nitrogenase component 1 n=2 Tax=Treponema endosymbiont of Eucomonympha sp. TaxID=1580831 RepID=UPI0007510507|nr:nitrogenase component 1 [Treponema endosymbiont of Eucomonympha sp.]
MTREYSGIRESRTHTATVTDWGGESCRGAGNFRANCIGQADRTFSQGLQCQQINSINALLSLADSAFIVHAPIGCTGCCSGANDVYRVGQMHRGNYAVKNARILATNLDERDIILGGEQKLRKAISLASERYNPKAIFIFTSCASGIIGDDIEAIVADAQKSAAPLLVPVHCEGFKSKVCASGYDAAFLAIGKYILKDAPKGDTIPDLLNLFAPPSVSYLDQLEIERMLGEIGIRINYIPFYSSFEKLRTIPRAAASTAICKVFADEFMVDLKEEYGIPFSHTIMPIGTRNTDKWYLGVAELFGKTAEAKAYIARQREQFAPLVQDIYNRLHGKRVFICGGTGRSFAAAALVSDFGMKLVGLETPTFDNDALIDFDYLNGVHGSYEVDVANMQPFEQVNLLQKLKPDVFVGVPSWAAKLGFPTTHVLDMKRPTLGYRNLVYLGNKMASQLENPGYNKRLSAHARLPYRDSWYESDPFKFIKQY